MSADKMPAFLPQYKVLPQLFKELNLWFVAQVVAEEEVVVGGILVQVERIFRN
jgi:hypothetical protein